MVVVMRVVYVFNFCHLKKKLRDGDGDRDTREMMIIKTRRKVKTTPEKNRPIHTFLFGTKDSSCSTFSECVAEDIERQRKRKGTTRVGKGERKGEEGNGWGVN